MPSDRDQAGKSEFDLDNEWYEAFADKVHSFGKKWPDPLTEEEERACAEYADSVARRPEGEKWDLPPRGLDTETGRMPQDDFTEDW